MSSPVNPKREIFASLARIGTALSSPVRLDLIELLAQGERSVDELARLTGTSVANTSQHLQKLKQAGLIVGRKDAQFVRYRLAGDEVVALFRALGIAGQAYLADVDRIVRTYLDAKDELEPVPAGDLLERARKGLVTVLDVRPPQEFAAGHVPGAVNIPVHELERRLAELPRRREVVAYCRGPFCLMSDEAVQLLRQRGYTAHKITDGVTEWSANGLPIET